MRGQVLFNTTHTALWKRMAGCTFERSMARSLMARRSGTAKISVNVTLVGKSCAMNWLLSAMSMNARCTCNFATVYPWPAYRVRSG